MTAYAGRRQRRQDAGRRHRGRRWLVALVVLIVVLVALDFIAKAVAESVAASEIQKQGKMAKPDVTIDGFPFLTQLAGRDFASVHIKIADLKAGPVTFTTVNAAATQVKPSSFTFKSLHIGHISGTGLIDFASLGNTLATEIGPLGTLLHGAGLNLSAAGPHEVKASLNLLVATGSATWRITRVSGSELRVRLVSSGGLPQSLLGSIQSLNLHIPPLPLGLTLNGVSVTRAGVVGTFSGSNVAVGT